jgi:UDP-N-acetyl-D-mannosaminuronate dehydrogenase
VILEHISEDEAFRRGFDCAVITTNHREFDYGRIASEAPLVVDTRHALKGHTGARIFRL